MERNGFFLNLQRIGRPPKVLITIFMTNKQFPIDLDFQTFFCVQKNGLAYFTDNF